MDGVWAVKELDGSILIGEQMKDARFFCFDIAQHQGQDVRQLALRERLTILDTEFNGKLLRPASGQGGEFLEAVLARGGEGVCAKHLDGFFGDPWTKCKRVVTLDLVVTDKVRGSIKLATIEGEDRGWCHARAAFDQIKIGDIVEIGGHSLTAKGRLREPRFVRIRRDKMQEPAASGSGSDLDR